MGKRKKIPGVTYHFEGSEREIVYEDIMNYSFETVFYVRDDGLVVPISKDTKISPLTKSCNWIFMYKEQLVEMLFIN